MVNIRGLGLSVLLGGLALILTGALSRRAEAGPGLTELAAGALEIGVTPFRVVGLGLGELAGGIREISSALRFGGGELGEAFRPLLGVLKEIAEFGTGLGPGCTRRDIDPRVPCPPGTFEKGFYPFAQCCEKKILPRGPPGRFPTRQICSCIANPSGLPGWLNTCTKQLFGNLSDCQQVAAELNL